MRGCVWVREFLKPWQVTDKIMEWMQPQNKGPGMLWGHSYITPMMSRDIISMIGGGVCHRGGVCHGEFKVDNFHMIILQILHKPAWNLVKLLCKYSYLIPSQFQALQSDKIHDIRQFKYSNFKSFHLLFDVGAYLPSWQAPSLIFEFWPTSIRIYVTPALNLRPGLNSVAFFTYIQKL